MPLPPGPRNCGQSFPSPANATPRHPANKNPAQIPRNASFFILASQPEVVLLIQCPREHKVLRVRFYCRRAVPDGRHDPRRLPHRDVVCPVHACSLPEMACRVKVGELSITDYGSLMIWRKRRDSRYAGGVYWGQPPIISSLCRLRFFTPRAAHQSISLGTNASRRRFLSVSYFWCRVCLKTIDSGGDWGGRQQENAVFRIFLRISYLGPRATRPVAAPLPSPVSGLQPRAGIHRQSSIINPKACGLQAAARRGSRMPLQSRAR